jgi:hypothetical protein
MLLCVIASFATSKTWKKSLGMDIYVQVIFGYKWSNVGIYYWYDEYWYKRTYQLGMTWCNTNLIPISGLYLPYTRPKNLTPVWNLCENGLKWQNQHLPNSKETKILPYQD